MLAALLQLFLRYDRSCELAKAGVQSVDHCKYPIVIFISLFAVSMRLVERYHSAKNRCKQLLHT